MIEWVRWIEGGSEVEFTSVSWAWFLWVPLCTKHWGWVLWVVYCAVLRNICWNTLTQGHMHKGLYRDPWELEEEWKPVCVCLCVCKFWTQRRYQVGSELRVRIWLCCGGGERGFSRDTVHQERTWFREGQRKNCLARILGVWSRVIGKETWCQILRGLDSQVKEIWL